MDVTDCNGIINIAFQTLHTNANFWFIFHYEKQATIMSLGNPKKKQTKQKNSNTKISPQLIILHVGNASMHDIKSAMLTIIHKRICEC